MVRAVVRVMVRIGVVVTVRVIFHQHFTDFSVGVFCVKQHVTVASRGSC